MTDQEAYDLFLVDTEYPWCWWCGRGLEHRPENWFGPWLIERAHIVNKPRVEDRRVVIMLCSACHDIQHGEQILLPGMQSVAPSIANMLWLKRFFDKSYYDYLFMAKYSIGKLPIPRCNRKQLEVYKSRRRIGPELTGKRTYEKGIPKIQKQENRSRWNKLRLKEGGR